MRPYDEAAAVLADWTEKEVRAAVGASPNSTAHADKDFEPTGPHRWFAEAIAEVATILALRRMAETTPAGFRSHAPAIRRKADEWTTSARLLPGITLAQWFAENEPLLQEGFSRQERVRVVAVALLPLFKQNPDSWEATEWLDVETRGTFREYLADWHARVPERLRPVVRRIAEEFGIEIQTARGDTG